MSRILQVASLEHAYKPIPIMRALAERPKAVFITDELIATPRYSAVWGAVIRYMQAGGTAICMGHFSCRLPTQYFRTFFSRAGLPWEFDGFELSQSLLNVDFLPREITDILPSSHFAKAVHLKNVGDASWYRLQHIVKTRSDDDVQMTDEQPSRNVQLLKDSSPVAMAQVGQGYLGFVGDVNSSEESNLVMIAMCGLYV